MQSKQPGEELVYLCDNPRLDHYERSPHLEHLINRHSVKMAGEVDNVVS